jgi:hypothetical protein
LTSLVLTGGDNAVWLVGGCLYSGSSTSGVVVGGLAESATTILNQSSFKMNVLDGNGNAGIQFPCGCWLFTGNKTIYLNLYSAAVVVYYGYIWAVRIY